MSSEVKRTKGGIVHPRVARAMARLGQDISLARRARGIGTEDFADRIGVSRGTLHRLESGEPGVTLNTVAMALHALGRLDALAELADPARDDITMMQMRDRAPKRIARRRQKEAPPVAASPAGGDNGDQASPPSSKYVGF